MQIVVALLAGIVFGIGLIVSGMSDPGKVIGFLDLSGNWDPSLAFVMAGAIAVGLIPFQRARHVSSALLGAPMRLPAARGIDRKLVLGSMTFGVGWGLAGYCPGPAIVSLATGGVKPVVFFISMAAGMALFQFLQSMQRPGKNLAT